MGLFFVKWLLLVFAWASQAELISVPEPLVNFGDSKYFSQYAFVVDKEKRILSIWKAQPGQPPTLEKTYAADMGKSEGDKKHVGDHKTPEGVYFFQKSLRGKYIPFELYGSRALTTDYPNYFDRRDGKTGSGIWLHAVPDSTPLTRGSRGCVVVRDKDILEAEQYFTPKRTPIVILDTLKMVPQDEAQKMRDRVVKFVNDWIEAWKQEDLETYTSFYHPSFRSRKMNLKAWKRYKSNVMAAQTRVDIKISNPLILASQIEGDTQEVTIKFIQNFESNLLKDLGEKTLYVYIKREADKLKLSIFGEEWRAIPQDLRSLAKTEVGPLESRSTL